MNGSFRLVAGVSIVALAVAACGSSSRSGSAGPASTAPASSTSTSVTATTDPSYHPTIDPAKFTTRITNPYFPLTPGRTLVYDGTRDGQPQHDEVVVTTKIRTVMGVRCVVVEDTVTSNGALVEKTSDWYAQARNGDVWYFGEDTKEYENGAVSSTHGTWEAGVDGAQPGVVMRGRPRVGDKYRQEYRPGEAEDRGQVLRIDAALKVPAGRYGNAVLTLDSDPLNPSKNDNKWYAQGVGLVKSARVAAGHREVVALVEVRAG